MMRGITIWLITCMLYTAQAQNTSGITGIHDTTFTLQNEWTKHIKSYPFIKFPTVVVNKDLIHANDIVYCNLGSRGLKLDLIYHAQDKKKKKRTAVIFIHGGGWRSGDKSLHYALIEHLAARGYVGIAPEYRLSTEALYPAAVQDIKAAIRWTRKNASTYNINPNRIVVAGHSAGGELAAFMGVTNGDKNFEGNSCWLKTSSKVNAVIDVDGTLSFVQGESSEMKDKEKRGASAQWLGYTPAENMDIFKEASPLTYVGAQCPPVLFLNSSVERMHAGREDFIKVLNVNHIYSEVKTFNDAPHSFCFFEPWFSQMVDTMDAFLKTIFS